MWVEMRYERRSEACMLYDMRTSANVRYMSYVPVINPPSVGDFQAA